MLPLIKRLFDSNEKEIGKIAPIVNRISSLEEKTKKLKKTDFKKTTEEFKKRIEKGESLENILPEAFALVREAARRTIGQRHFDVQIMASIVLSQGKIAEQKTGEGKTLSAVPALYLHALTGRGVHLVTVNDYLARRDAGWMGPIFDLLGISVSSIISEQSFIYDPKFANEGANDFRLTHLRPITRKEAYEKDVTYGINSEFGFDYLRDNMQQNFDNVVQRGFYFAIVDEVDSVLIDEARTPHIISAPDETPTNKYYEYSKIVDKLSSDTDYKIDEKLHTAHLTDHGLSKIEKLYGIENIYEKDFDTVYHIEAALKAKTLYKKEKDYIVKDGQVILVDEFTGRLMEGRRLSEGLHQAIEAKEEVAIQRESKTLATVSLQNYFRMYERLSGMTGTAETEAAEFHKIYGLDVVVVPTNKEMIRRDHSDSIYKTGRAKFSAVASEIEKANKKGQPVLIGTTSIEKNEILSELLRRRGIKHELLNAKNHVREAEIIAKAGERGAVTVATNMAGRGVDIILGGAIPVNPDGTEKTGTKEFEDWKKHHDEVLKLGGLYVIGTERHESRRIDNQLRGRSGRQGDPGTSKFFVALDDDIMRIFGGDQIAGLMTRFNLPEDVPLEAGIVSKAIEQAQAKVERFHFDSRKYLVEYDDVLNKQREIIYLRRRKILESLNEKDFRLKDDVLQDLKNSITNVVMSQSAQGDSSEKIVAEFSTIIPFDEKSRQELAKRLDATESETGKINLLFDLSKSLYEAREKQMGGDVMRQIENWVTLSVIDKFWMDHLDAVDSLRAGIGLRAYGQKDPLVEYKNEAFNMFEALNSGIEDEISHRIFKVHIATPEPSGSETLLGRRHQHVHTVEKPAGGDMGADETPQKANSKKQLATSNQPLVRRSTTSSSASIPVSSPNPIAASVPNISRITTNQNASEVSNVQTVKKQKIGRNDPCWCGSGKKYKRCHYPN